MLKNNLPPPEPLTLEAWKQNHPIEYAEAQYLVEEGIYASVEDFLAATNRAIYRMWQAAVSRTPQNSPDPGA